MKKEIEKVQLLLKDSKKENSEFGEKLQQLTLESIIQKSKNKKYMKEKYGCKFCAFYHQIDLPDEQLEELIYKQLIKKLYKLTNIDFSGYKIEDLDYFNDYKKISEDKDSLIKSILLNYMQKLKQQLPSLCIYKNEINTKPCVHYELKVLDVNMGERLEYHNSKIERRYNSLSVFISSLLSVIAIAISVFSLTLNLYYA